MSTSLKHSKMFLICQNRASKKPCRFFDQRGAVCTIITQQIVTRNSLSYWQPPLVWRVLSCRARIDHHSTGAYALGSTPYHGAQLDCLGFRAL